MNEGLKTLQALELIRKDLELLGLPSTNVYGPNILILGPISIWIRLIDHNDRVIIQVSELKIDKKFRNLGFGSTIMMIVASNCHNLNVPLGLFVNPKNKIAYKWYLDMGFKKIDDNAMDGSHWLEMDYVNLDYFKEKINYDL